MLGALHDATEREYTYRLAQKEKDYVESVAEIVRRLGFKSWTYREGKTRNLYVAEFSKKAVEGARITTEQDKIDYVRGYFDSEGSVPEKRETRFYIYFAQNDKEDLEQVRTFLIGLGISCGALHVPSKRKPTYLRFYVSASSHRKFAELIGSWHPRKNQLLGRMMI
jgi:intein-encoded DNA endonuclease-like protein